MNDRPTPETDAMYSIRVRLYPQSLCVSEVVRKADARKLERERDELRELYGLDTQTLRAERDEARDALRVRIEEMSCPECGCKVLDFFQHAETCRHYAVEREVTQ